MENFQSDVIENEEQEVNITTHHKPIFQLPFIVYWKTS